MKRAANEYVTRVTAWVLYIQTWKGQQEDVGLETCCRLVERVRDDVLCQMGVPDTSGATTGNVRSLTVSKDSQ